MQNLTNQQYGKWTVLEFSYKNKYYHSYWKCQCECGVIKNIYESSLKCGTSTKCKQCSSKNFPKKLSIDRFNNLWISDKEMNCWLWLGGLDKDGYGHFKVNKKTIQAHRFSYEHHKGPIPDGLVIDHLCRNPSCVNPEHLEAVTHKENLNRGIHRNSIKTHCKNNHKFTPENTHVDKNGWRYCRECRREYDKIRYKKKKELN